MSILHRSPEGMDFATVSIAAEHPSACAQCSLRKECIPAGLSESDFAMLDTLVSTRRYVRKCETLFRQGGPLTSVYAIRSGMFKLRAIRADGRDQVTGFRMAGELMGLDAIDSGFHACDAIAIEDSAVCVIPYERLMAICAETPSLQHHFYRLMSREIVSERWVMALLVGKRAEARLAAFLLNLLQRMHVRGFSDKELRLRMTREEIGSYLGLTLETVSRALSRLARANLISVRQRLVRIEDSEGLRMLITAGESPADSPT